MDMLHRRLPLLVSLLALTILAWLAPLGCRSSDESEDDRTRPQTSAESGQEAFEFSELAERLASPEVSVREDAATRVGRLGTSGQRAVLDALAAAEHRVAARLTRRLAERAVDRGMPGVGARWYAVPAVEEVTDGKRHDRLVRTVEALLAAAEYAEALELSRTRLAGHYPEQVEQRLATLERRAEQGLARE